MDYETNNEKTEEVLELFNNSFKNISVDQFKVYNVKSNFESTVYEFLCSSSTTNDNDEQVDLLCKILNKNTKIKEAKDKIMAERL